MIRGKSVIKFSPIAAGSLGVLISMVISMILLLVGAGLISGDYMQINAGNYYTVGVQAIAGLVGCFLGEKLAGEKLGLACCITGGGYLLILTIISLLFFNGLGGSYLWGIGMIGIVCACTIILCSKNVKQKRKRRKHFR